MENMLKRLLEAEKQAGERVDEARQQRDRIIEQAQAEAREAEARFERRIPELHQSYMKNADERAEQEIAHVKRQHLQRLQRLTHMAEQNREAGIERALSWLLDPGNP